jgi:tetratricopeptide (TPR) repeat protein
MRIRIITMMIAAALTLGSTGVTGAEASFQQQLTSSERKGERKADRKNDQPGDVSEFDRLRIEGFDAVYNLDYKTARERFLQMTKLAPDHPAGYLYLANNLWLETLYLTRRLTTSVYTGGSFYSQDAKEDKVDPKRDREFNDLIKQAVAVSKARLLQNPKDVDALYYEASALGIRAAYSSSVKRGFSRGIGDANDSVKIQREVIKLDPNYVDAYLSIGLYEYVIDSLPFGWRLLARFAGLKGSKSKGIEHLELVVSRGKYGADDSRVVLLGIYSKEGKRDRALEIISNLSTHYPRNYIFGLERASMLYRNGQSNEGGRAFAELLKDDRVTAQVADLVNYQWGEALSSKQEYETALARFKEVQRWPKSNAGLISLAHLRAGEALDALGKRDEAMAEYQMVLKRENVFDSHRLATQYVKKPYVPSKS